MCLCGIGTCDTVIRDSVFCDVGVEEGGYDADAGLLGGEEGRED